MKRARVLAALTAGLMMAASGTAMAGEVTGNGKPTPVQSYRAGSICSFSGQNDDPGSEEMFDGGRVQSFGDIVQEFVQVVGYRGASTFRGLITEEGPGLECRGYASNG